MNKIVKFFIKNKGIEEDTLPQNQLNKAERLLLKWRKNEKSLTENEVRVLFDNAPQDLYGLEEVVIEIIEKGENYPYEWLLLNDSINKPVWQRLKIDAIQAGGKVSHTGLPDFPPIKNPEQWIKETIKETQKDGKPLDDNLVLYICYVAWFLNNDYIDTSSEYGTFCQLLLRQILQSPETLQENDFYCFEGALNLLKHFIRTENRNNILSENYTELKDPLTEGEARLLFDNVPQKLYGLEETVIPLIEKGLGYPYQGLLLNDSQGKPVWEKLKIAAIRAGGKVSNTGLPDFPPIKNPEQWLNYAIPSNINEQSLYDLVKQLT